MLQYDWHVMICLDKLTTITSPLCFCCPQAEQAGLPPPADGTDTTEITLRTEQGLLTTVHNEEVAGQARADNDISHNTADQLRANMSSLLSSQIVSVNSAGCECIWDTLMRETDFTHLSPDWPSPPTLLPYRATPDHLVAAS